MADGTEATQTELILEKISAQMSSMQKQMKEEFVTILAPIQQKLDKLSAVLEASSGSFAHSMKKNSTILDEKPKKPSSAIPYKQIKVDFRRFTDPTDWLYQDPLKAMEEHRRDLEEYRQFLESCDFIRANTHWCDVDDRLEEDERCSRLVKIERFEIFQEYIRDLENQRKIQKKQERAEIINRKKFRHLLEEHVADGTVTAKSHWHDYCMKVMDIPEYKAVSSNTSGLKPKDLFDYVVCGLQDQERAKAREERKRNIIEYRQFLESCDFIEANSQWCKVHDRLEDEERCSRLEKIDRFEIFQAYIRDLGKEGEQRKIQKEQQRAVIINHDKKKLEEDACSPESASESRHKRHKRDHRDSSVDGGYEELEDGKLGENGKSDHEDTPETMIKDAQKHSV